MIQQVLMICVVQLNVIFILSLVNITSVKSFGLDRGNCGTLKKQFFSAGNRVLKNSEYRTKTTLNYVICGRDCSMDEYCKSFNFYECKKLCELNNASRAGHLQDFLEDQGSVYFDAEEDTPIYSPTTQPSSTEPTTPFFSTQSPLPKLSSCQEFRDAGYSESNVYTIYPSGSSVMRVYCDMETDGRGWIVFQRRIDGSIDFYRNWTEYQTGFGDLSGEFWLGNDNLVELTSAGYTNLRVDLTTWTGEEGHAEFSGVRITGIEYIFSYDNFVGGNADDSLNDNKNNPFQTKDNNDNGENCAEQTRGAWWFKDCTVKSHLNGEYEQNPVGRRGIVWYKWNQPIKACSMILRKP
ncbi:ficolin-2-like [Asterias amurensis]|uniref:ficolin-2-like n=1 Tax=Asterias amurensis TaxID=7602 RepID=UPI003AB3C38C